MDKPLFFAVLIFVVVLCVYIAPMACAQPVSDGLDNGPGLWVMGLESGTDAEPAWDLGPDISYFELCASFLASILNVLVVYCAHRIFNRRPVFTHVFIALHGASRSHTDGAVAALWISKSAYITSPCTTTFASEGLYLALIDITTLLPVVSSFVLSAYLCIVKERRRAASPSGPPKRKANALLFVFSSSAWTLLAMLPNRSYLTWHFAVHVHGSHSSCPGDLVWWLAYSTSLLMAAYP
ncbi:hypothetical protein AAVH_15405, partial [Aphelenchoides avenae]